MNGRVSWRSLVRTKPADSIQKYSRSLTANVVVLIVGNEGKGHREARGHTDCLRKAYQTSFAAAAPPPFIYAT